MRIVMYSPWPARSFADHATNYTASANNRAHKTAGKAYEVAVHAKGCLATLTATDRLYVMGHGVDQGSQILADSDLDWLESYRNDGYSSFVNHKNVKCVALKPDELLAKLVEAGLPAAVTDVRLQVCGGGDRQFTDFGWNFTALLLKRNAGARVTAYKGKMLLVEKTGRKRGNAFSDGPMAPSAAAKTFKMVINDDQDFHLY